MKSKLLILLSSLMITSILLIGCNQTHKNNKVVIEEVTPALPEKPAVNLDTYFPVIKDTMWQFNGGHPTEDVTVGVDFIKEDTFQLRIKNKNGTVAKIFTKDPEAIYEVATIEDADIKQDYTNFRQYKKPILKLPIEEGNSWKLENGEIREITDMDVIVSTPLGEIKCIEITTEGDGYTQKVYYGEKTGPIKILYKSDDGSKVTQKITEFGTNKAMEQEVKVYLAKSSTSKLGYILKGVPVRTNEEPKHFLTDLLKQVPSEEYVVAISKSAIIESIYMDDKTKKLYLDMSKEFYEMSYEGNDENLAIKSLISTVGGYYNAQQVVLTVGGEPYNSGKIAFKDGQGIPVQLENISQIEE